MIHHESNPLNDRNEGKELFKYLVKIALADGTIDTSEEKLLHKAGKKFGFTDPEIDHFLTHKFESTYHPPIELEKKFHNLFIMIQLIAADEEIHDDELKFVRYFALASGFDPEKAENIISFIIKGLHDNADEEDLFQKYRKQSF